MLNNQIDLRWWLRIHWLNAHENFKKTFSCRTWKNQLLFFSLAVQSNLGNRVLFCRD